MVLDALGTILGKCDADKTEKGRTEFVKTDLPRYATPINDMYAKSDGPYLLGTKMTVADLKVNMIIDFLSAGMLNYIPTDSMSPFEHLRVASENVDKEPKIAAWIEAHVKK